MLRYGAAQSVMCVIILSVSCSTVLRKSRINLGEDDRASLDADKKATRGHACRPSILGAVHSSKHCPNARQRKGGARHRCIATRARACTQHHPELSEGAVARPAPICSLGTRVFQEWSGASERCRTAIEKIR